MSAEEAPLQGEGGVEDDQGGNHDDGRQEDDTGVNVEELEKRKGEPIADEATSPIGEENADKTKRPQE